jgi:hypothetical protein
MPPGLPTAATAAVVTGVPGGAPGAVPAPLAPPVADPVPDVPPLNGPVDVPPFPGRASASPPDPFAPAVPGLLPPFGSGIVGVAPAAPPLPAAAVALPPLPIIKRPLLPTPPRASANPPCPPAPACAVPWPCTTALMNWTVPPVPPAPPAVLAGPPFMTPPAPPRASALPPSQPSPPTGVCLRDTCTGAPELVPMMTTSPAALPFPPGISVAALSSSSACRRQMRKRSAEADHLGRAEHHIAAESAFSRHGLRVVRRKHPASWRRYTVRNSIASASSIVTGDFSAHLDDRTHDHDMTSVSTRAGTCHRRTRRDRARAAGRGDTAADHPIDADPDRSVQTDQHDAWRGRPRRAVRQIGQIDRPIDREIAHTDHREIAGQIHGGAGLDGNRLRIEPSPCHPTPVCRRLLARRSGWNRARGRGFWRRRSRRWRWRRGLASGQKYQYEDPDHTCQSRNGSRHLCPHFERPILSSCSIASKRLRTGFRTDLG